MIVVTILAAMMTGTASTEGGCPWQIRNSCNLANPQELTGQTVELMVNACTKASHIFVQRRRENQKDVKVHTCSSKDAQVYDPTVSANDEEGILDTTQNPGLAMSTTLVLQTREVERCQVVTEQSNGRMGESAFEV